jgi:S-DNA-T family DNA segregation ATPase FtsK/SpoIIIE
VAVLVWGAWREALGHALAAHRTALGRRVTLFGAPEVAPAGGGSPLASGNGPVRAAAAAAYHAAEQLPRGWLGATWPELAGPELAGPELAGPEQSRLLRIGIVHADAGLSVPLHVPFLDHGHLAIDAPVRDARVAALVQGVLLRVLAASAPGAARVLAHDPAGLGRVFAPFAPLVEAGVVVEVGGEREDLLTALDTADAQVRAAWQEPGAVRQRLLLALAGLPPGAGPDVEARLAALAHAGPAARVSLLLTGWPPPRPAGHPPAPTLEATTQLSARGGAWSPGLPGVGTGLDLPVELDPAPPARLLETVCRSLAASATGRAAIGFADLLTDPEWTQRSATGLSTPVGRAGDDVHVLRFDDTTPHWLVAGRSGAGKTVFLLDVLAGLAARYPPDELQLYLLDFKEGVSFTEFTPTPHDPSWMPHAVAVGIESDREYGLAVLRALRAEMSRRAMRFKQAGVTSLAALRTADPAAAVPRVLAVIDEFQVLFAGNDATARQASELLEDIARKGRSFGVHLVLASQTTSGIEALQTKLEAIFGQFPLRVALAGGGNVLDPLNTAADGLAIGTAVINASAGFPGANTLVRLPLADPQVLAALRQRLCARWRQQVPQASPPAVFAGFAEQHVIDDPAFAALTPDATRRNLLVGRAVDVGSSTASVAVDAVPGRHLAVVGPSGVGADVLHAALVGLGRQHRPGTARFVIAPLVQAGDDAARAAAEELRAGGHPVRTVPLPQLGPTLAELAQFEEASPGRPTYLVLFGAEAAGPVLSVVSPETFRPGTDDLRTVVQSGPVHGVHVLGWWRSLARLGADLGPTAREDVACLLSLNVPCSELQSFLGRYDLHHDPRPNRALLLDRHDETTRLIVPFVRDASLRTTHDAGEEVT